MLPEEDISTFSFDYIPAEKNMILIIRFHFVENLLLIV